MWPTQEFKKTQYKKEGKNQARVVYPQKTGRVFQKDIFVLNKKGVKYTLRQRHSTISCAAQHLAPQDLDIF